MTKSPFADNFATGDFLGLAAALTQEDDGSTPRQINVAKLNGVTAGGDSIHLSSVPFSSKEYQHIRRSGKRSKRRHTRKYIRYSNCIPGAEDGLAWPELVSGSRVHCTDGSIMLVLDTGAEASVILSGNLIPHPTNIPLPLISFNGAESMCPQTGEMLGAAYDCEGEITGVNLGWAGHTTDGIKDNLASVPTLRRLGWMFWFGDHPFAVTPQGKEIPLYMNHNGYLGLRIHTTKSVGVNANSLATTRPHEVGFLSNDNNLWHLRMVHQHQAVLDKMRTEKCCTGLPVLRHYTNKHDKCITCGLGKSCKFHVGPVKFNDKVKQDKYHLKFEKDHQTSYYPLEQIHMDLCEMDSPDLYGNTYFLAIVDRATGYLWDIPLKKKDSVHLIVDEFITTIVKPYHAHQTHQKLRELSLQKIADSSEGTSTGDDALNKLKQVQGFEQLTQGLRKIRCDQGTEFYNKKMTTMLKSKHNVTLDPVPAYTKDGRAEAAIKKLCTYTRCCLIESGLKKCFWSSIMGMVTHVLNRSWNMKRKTVAYSELTGLKPNVSYFRQPGCIALCHEMTSKGRKKLEERAFIGILVGYDSPSRSWVFLNPKTGRTHQSIYANFYERSRAPQEHIEMGHLVVDEPKWHQDVKEHCWRCQLWPKVLWPGMNKSQLGNTPDDFPDHTSVANALDPNLLHFDTQLDQRLQPNTVPDSDKDESDPQSAEELESQFQQKLHVKANTPEGTEKSSDGTDIQPNDVLTLGPRLSSAPQYVKSRCRSVVGKKVKEVITSNNRALLKCTDKDGTPCNYRLGDLKYDLKHGRLNILPGSPEDALPPQHELNAVLIRRLINNVRTDNSVKDNMSKCLFFDEYVEVSHLFDAHSFDKEECDGKLSTAIFETDVGTSEWGKPSDLAKVAVVRLAKNDGTTVSFSQLDHSAHAHTYYRTRQSEYFVKEGKEVLNDNDFPPAFFTSSSQIDQVQSYDAIPTPAELVGYRGNGTYINKNGLVRPSHIVERAKAVHRTTLNQIYAEGRRFVLGVPDPSTINSMGVPDERGFVNGSRPLHVPKGTKKALYDPEYFPHWPEVVWKELSGLYKMGCMEYESEDHPEVRHYGVLPSHIVFTDKWNAESPAQFLKCKARLVAGGNHERAPENAFENFSPTAGAVINRMFDAYCVYRGWKIFSTDCAQAFLNAKTSRPIFVRPPPGVGRKGYVWRLLKHLYGLCSSPKAWMKCLTDAMAKLGFTPFDDDPCILRRVDKNGDETIVEVFVDDIKWAGTNEEKVLKIIKTLHEEHFAITFDGEVKTYLGMQYTYDTSVEGKYVLTVDQTAYVESMIARFELEETRNGAPNFPRGKADTPLPAFHSEDGLYKAMGGDIINKDEKLKDWAKRFTFPTIIGSLIHAMVHTRADISYAVSILSRSMATPELYHYKAARRLLLYLRDTKEKGVRYSQEEMHKFESSRLVTATTDESLMEGKKDLFDQYLEASVDASFADCDKTYRSTSGFVVWFGGSPIEWECKRQPLVTLSTMESEYVAASKCVCSIRFIHKLVGFLGLNRKGPTKVHEDNSACVAISTKPVHKSRSKHIGVKYHNVREASMNGEVELVQVWTEHQVSDIFTKSLCKADFIRCRETLMGYVPFNEMVRAHPKPQKEVTKKLNLVYTPNTRVLSDARGDSAIVEPLFNWPEQTVSQIINWQDKAPGCMSWRDCIMGKPEYESPGYGASVMCC